jgi:OOP family OmpA-OmpF porin
MVKKIIGIAICLTAIALESGAQELGIELNGGLQGTQFQLQNGQAMQLPGGSLGLSYSFRLGSHWDLLTGLTGGIYRSQATLQDGVVSSYDQVDDAGSAFRYNVKTTGYKETQQFIAASIPLLLQYHTDGARTRWYFNAGGRALLPLNASIQQSAQQLSLSGYYPDYNVELTNLPQHGFGTIKSWKASQTLKLKPAAALSAATGLSFRLSPGARLYAGLYVNYGITDLKDQNSALPLVTYSSTGINGIQANSVVNTQNAGQVTLLSFGLQVRLSFGSTKEKPAAQARTKKEPQPPAELTVSDDEAAIIHRPVLFVVVGETSLPEFEKQKLDAVANILNQCPDIRISIVGHVCNSGTKTESMKVGTARAKAVAKYLRGIGIDRSRMDVSSASVRDPVLSNNPDANYRNRRVVIRVE